MFNPRIFVALMVLASALASHAQTIDVSIFIDDPGSVGCTVTPTGLTPISGVDARLSATVDRVAAQVVNVDLSVCSGTTFGPPTSLGGGQALGNNLGLMGADVVEMSVLRSAVSSTSNNLRISAAAENAIGADAVTAGVLNVAPAIAVPGLGLAGLLFLIVAILMLAWFVFRRNRTLTTMLLLGITFAALAMNFMVDGQVGDWSSLSPIATDSAGDSTFAETAVDIVAVFAAQEDQGGGPEIFFRVDMADTIIDNRPPDARDDALSTAEDLVLSGDLFADNGNGADTDPDADAFTVTRVNGAAVVGSVVTLASGAQVTVNANGSFTFDPGAAFNDLAQGESTSETLTYTIDDGISGSDQALVTITLNGTNDAPAASDDLFAATEDTGLNPPAPGVLVNDGDPDASDTLTAVLDSPPANSLSFVFNSDGSFSYTPAMNFSGSDNFTYHANDGLADSNVATVVINVGAVNDAPVANDDAGDATDEETAITTSNVLTNDTDADPDMLSVQSVDALSASGAGITNNGDGTFGYDPSISTGLNALSVGQMTTDTFSYTATDGLLTDTAIVSIVVTGVNDPMTANDDAGAGFATDEDTTFNTANVLANDSDPDSADVLSVQAVDPASAQGAAISDNLDGTFSYDPTGAASLQALAGGAVVSDTFSYTGTDGNGSMASATVTLAITGINDNPVIAFPGSGALFTNTGPVNLDPAATLSDVDSPDFDTGELTVSLALSAAPSMCDIADTLTVENQGMGATQIGFDGVNISYEGAPFGAVASNYMCADLGGGLFDITPLLVDLGPAASQAAVTALVQALQYSSGSADEQNREASAMVTDGDGGTSNAALTIVTLDLNQPPVITSDGGGATAAVNAAENQTAVTTVAATDSDLPAQTLTFSLTGGADQALFSIVAGSGVLSFNTAPDFEMPGDAGTDNVYDVQVTVTDNGAPNLSDVQDIAVTVTDVNEAPTITSDGGGATAAVNAAENQTAVTTVAATDSDLPAQTLTFSLTGGADQALFSIVAGSGVLSFNTAPNFEMPGDAGTDNVYDVQVTVTDNGAPNLSDVQDLAVTVTDVNEAPTITSDGGGATAAVNAAENQTAVTTVAATDSDLPAQTLTFSLTGGADQALFSIVAGSGVLSFNTAPDFEMPGDAGTDNVYDVQVTVTDNGAPNLSDVQDIAVTVTDVNEAPTITSDGGGATAAVNAAENQTAVTTVAATDSDLPAQTLTFSLTGGADQALFSIVAGSGVLSFNTAPDFEMPGDAGTDNVYDVQVTVTDNGAPNLSDVQDIAVTVTDVNEAPTITSDGGGATAAVNAAENQTAVTTVAATDSDLPAQTLTFSLTGGADQALFSIVAGSGVLSFNTAPNFEMPGDAGSDNVYDVQVTVTDNGAPNLSDVQDLAVTVTDVNEAPTITSDGGGATAAVNAAENQTAVTTVAATDSDLPAQTLTFSLTGGADQALFSIVAGSGVLSFNTAPDFEMPGDAGTDNVYDVQVTVTDNGAPNLSDVQDLAVTVTDANEAPTGVDDGFTNVIINTQYEVLDMAAAGPFDPPRRQVSGNLLANDTDPDAVDAGNLVVQVVTNVATSHASGTGRITINADGTFTYLPPLGIAGDASTATFEDSFTYTVEDTATNTGTATINFSILMSPVVWFIDNSKGAGDGRSSSPFNSIAAFNASAGPAAGDTVFIHSQNGANADYTSGISLLNSQSLLGEGANLVIDSTTLVGGGAGQHPTLTTTNATGINLASGNTVRGLNIGNTGSGTGLVGNAFGTLTIDNVGIGGTGGILNLTNGTVTDPTAGDFTFGSLSTTANPGAGIVLNTVVGGFTVDTSTSITGTGGTLGIDIDASPGSFDFGLTTISGGTDAGVDITTGGMGTFTFDSLSVTNDSGTGLRATGGTINIAGATNTINSTGGAGIDMTGTTLGGGATFSSVSSSGSAGDGINLDSVTGALTINGGSITGSTGIALDLNAGSSNLTYAGSITNTAGRSVEVTNRMGGAVIFQTGSINDTGATGILIENNSAGSVSFNGTVNVTNSTGTGVTVQSNTGGSTSFADLDIDNTTSNAVGLLATGNAGAHTLSTTTGTIDAGTGTAVDIDNTILSVTLVSVDSDPGLTAGPHAPGIDLRNTTGSFTVTGTGAVAGSGGTIANKDGADASTNGIGVYLESVTNVSLSNMQLNDFENFAISGTSVNGFTLANSIVDATGMGFNGTSAGEGSVRFANLLGSAAITNSTIADGFENNLAVVNTTGTLDRLTVTGGSIIGLNSGTGGQDGILVSADGASTTLNVTVSGTTFQGARGDLIRTDSQNSSTMDVVIRDNTFANAQPTVGGGIAITGAGGTTLTYDVSGTVANAQTFSDADQDAILINTGAGTISGTIRNNKIGVSGTAGSGSLTGNGITVSASATSNHTVSINGNDIDGVSGFAGIDVAGADSATINATITNNTIDELAGFVGISTISGFGGVTDTVSTCVDMRTNTVDASAAFGLDYFIDHIGSPSTYNFPGYGGPMTPGASPNTLDTFLNGQNTFLGIFGGDSSFADNVSGTGTGCP